MTSGSVWVIGGREISWPQDLWKKTSRKHAVLFSTSAALEFSRGYQSSVFQRGDGVLCNASAALWIGELNSHRSTDGEIGCIPGRAG